MVLSHNPLYSAGLAPAYTTPDKVDLSLSFNTAFAIKVYQMCQSSGTSSANTFQLIVTTASGVKIQDITNVIKTFVKGVSSLDETSEISVSIDDINYGDDGYVEFYGQHDGGLYEIWSNTLPFVYSAVAAAPFMTGFGTTDGVQLTLSPVQENSSGDGYTGITHVTFLFFEKVAYLGELPTAESVTLAYNYAAQDQVYEITDALHGTHFIDNVYYKVVAYYKNSKGNSLTSSVVEVQSGPKPNPVRSLSLSLAPSDNTGPPATSNIQFFFSFPSGNSVDSSGAYLDPSSGTTDPNTVITSFKIWMLENAEYNWKHTFTLADITDPASTYLYSDTSLIPGTSYTFKMTAVSQAGEGDINDATSDSIVYCDQAPPVTSLTGLFNEGVSTNPYVLSLTWDASTNYGGGSLDKYHITVDSNEYYSSVPSITISDASFGSGFLSGSRYHVVVNTLTTENGNDGYPGKTDAITVSPSHVPDPVTGAYAEPDDSSMVIKWTPVTNSMLYDLSFNRYIINLSNTSGYDKTDYILNQDMSGHQFNDLSNNVPYTWNISVETKNSFDHTLHTSTDVSGNSTPIVNPLAPTGVHAFTDLNNLPYINVNWTAPSNANVCEIVKYTITRSGTGADTTITSVDVDDLLRSYTDTSGNKGVTYTYVVTAYSTNPNDITGALLVGDSSIASEEATAFIEPRSLDQGMLETPTPGDSQITLNWLPDPSANHYSGLPTDGYYIRNAALSTEYDMSASNPLTKTIGGLTNGDSYTFTISPYVVYTDDNGSYKVESLSSTSFVVSVPYTNPGPVTALTGVSSTTYTANPSNTLTWVLPTNTGGFPIVSIQIYKSSTGPDSPFDMIQLSAVDASYTDFDVIIGYNYTYSVEVSTNAVESGLVDVPMNSTRASISDNIPRAPPVIDSLVLNLSKNIVVTMTQNGSQVFNYLMFAVPDNATSTDQAEIINNGHPNPETPLELDNAPVTFTIDAAAESFAELIVVVSNAVGMGFKAQGLQEGSGSVPTP